MYVEDTRPGYCGCGCNQRVRHRYVHGHNRRRSQTWTVEDRGYLTPCWIWQGSRNRYDYGYTRIGTETPLAHRFVYVEYKGAIPGDLDLDHLCRVHACVNPDHLEPVTVKENTRRGMSAKLSVADVREIKMLQIFGCRGSDIAREFGVSAQIVCDIKKGRKWADVVVTPRTLWKDDCPDA